MNARPLWVAEEAALATGGRARGDWSAFGVSIDTRTLEKGDLKFTLHGNKLQGSWVLVRTRGFGKSSKPSWLLIKHKDRYAATDDLTTAKPKSVLSKRLMAEIAKAAGGASGDQLAKLVPAHFGQ